ncbi:MAG: hypothetical protein OHK0040_07490 [bacterium]
MKKLIFLFLFTIFVVNLYAQDDWQTTIKIRAKNIDSRVIFGQNKDATDSFDTAYDVSFFGSGVLSAYFIGDGGNLFKDIRTIDKESFWTLRIELKDSSIPKVELFWNLDNLPLNYELFIQDPLDNVRLNMKEHKYYSFPNTGVRYIDIEVKRIN